MKSNNDRDAICVTFSEKTRQKSKRQFLEVVQASSSLQTSFMEPKQVPMENKNSVASEIRKREKNTYSSQSATGFYLTIFIKLDCNKCQ